MVHSMKNGLYKPKSYYSEQGVDCLRMYNIENGQIKWFDIKRMTLSKEEIEGYKLLKGDLLVNRVNSRELVGKTAPINGFDEPVVYESKNIRISLNSNLANHKYINYWFLLSANNYFNSNAQQTVGMASINQKQISNFNFPYCSLQEQTQIVKEIETRLSVCDNAVKNINEALKKSEALRQSILKKAFEGKLLNDAELQACRKEPDWEPAEKLLERIKKEKK